MNAENQKLWDQYCELRDKLIAQHHECLKKSEKTPRNVWMFVVGRDRFRTFREPDYVYPKRAKDWLKQAIKRCEKAIEFPNSI